MDARTQKISKLFISKLARNINKIIFAGLFDNLKAEDFDALIEKGIRAYGIDLGMGKYDWYGYLTGKMRKRAIVNEQDREEAFMFVVQKLGLRENYPDPEGKTIFDSYDISKGSFFNYYRNVVDNALSNWYTEDIRHSEFFNKKKFMPYLDEDFNEDPFSTIGVEDNEGDYLMMIEDIRNELLRGDKGERQAKVFDMLLEGSSKSEIGEEFGVTGMAVKDWVDRIKRRVIKYFNKAGIEIPVNLIA